MEANQLRIGNIIQYKKGHLSRIIGIFSSEKEFIIVRGLKDSYIDGSYELSNFNPITLTEEWMLKFGFKKVEYSDERHGFGTEYHLKVNDGIFLNYSDDFSLAIYRNEKAMEDEVGILPEWEAVKYVHGLQNLIFTLVGEEITLKQ
jgi:hypothetical protein